jgi:AcrR family transcriptional regulator
LTAPLDASQAAVFDPASVKILDAAIAEFTDFGLRRVSVDDIAARAGVHRTTVYRYFKTKQEIVQAAAAKWIQDLLGATSAEVSHISGVDERFVEGFALTLGRIREAPLIQRILSTDTAAAVRAVTVDGAPALAMIRASFASWFPQGQGVNAGFDPEGVAEVTARLGISLVLDPGDHFDIESLDGRRAFARRYLLPMLATAPESLQP